MGTWQSNGEGRFYTTCEESSERVIVGTGKKSTHIMGLR